MSEGRKNDEGKLRYDLIPVDALRELARIYTFGATKYDDRNWEQGIKFGRVYGAIQRHLNAFWGGEVADAESGLHPLAHAAWGCLALLAYEMRGMSGEFDDRIDLEPVMKACRRHHTFYLAKEGGCPVCRSEKRMFLSLGEK